MKDRDIRRSLMKHLRSLLTTPPASSGLSSLNVYGEDHLRAALETPPTFQPARPFVFLLDSYIRPVPAVLPVMVVDTSVKQRPHEIGNRRGRRTDVMAHVFGRTRGERDDLGSFIVDHLGAAVPIYSFPSSGSTPSFLENAIVRDQIDLENVFSSDAVRQEGSLDLWQTVTFSIETLS